MKRKLIWKGTLGEAMKHPIFNLALEEVEKIIEEYRNIAQYKNADGELIVLICNQLIEKIKEELK